MIVIMLEVGNEINGKFISEGIYYIGDPFTAAKTLKDIDDCNWAVLMVGLDINHKISAKMNLMSFKKKNNDWVVVDKE